MSDTIDFNPTETAPFSAEIAAAQTVGELPSRQLRILVAEEEVVFLSHITALLQNTFGIAVDITDARDGIDAVASALVTKPDLVIMDVSLPVLDGFRAARKIWQEFADCKILFWSRQCKESYVRNLVMAPDHSFFGYVFKSNPDEDLVYAVESMLLHNNPYLDPLVRKALRATQKDDWLTDVEVETLNDLALGLTDKAIAKRRGISLRGLQSRIGSLYRKLLLTNSDLLQKTRAAEVVNLRTRLVFESVRRGLITPEDMAALDHECNIWLTKTLSN